MADEETGTRRDHGYEHERDHDHGRGRGGEAAGRRDRGRRGRGGARREADREADGAGDAPAPGGESDARRIALDALSRSARTRGQLEALLERKGVASEAAGTVLDRFEEVGLVDDAGYAEAFVESRHRVRGQGGRAIAFELRRRGVADEVVAEAVGALDPEQQFDTACRVAAARLRRLSGLPTEVKVRRLGGLLARKGYSGDVAVRAVRHVLDTADVDMADADTAGMDGPGELDDWTEE